MERAAALAVDAKVPNILAYTIERIGAVGSPKSRQVLEKLSGQLAEMQDPHRFHENQMAITEILKK
jgi:hypothetical protein